MLSNTLGQSRQSTVQRPVESALPPRPRSLSAGFGSLAGHHLEQYETGFNERVPSCAVTDRTIVGTVDSALGGIGSVHIDELPAALFFGGLRSSCLAVGESLVIGPIRPLEPVPPERDAVPFVMAIRTLVETEQLFAARQMLAAAPTHILTDPLVAKMRSILAPPVVKRVQKRDVDRIREYDWLRTDGHKYRGRWVALDGNRLLAVASSLRELREQLKTATFTHPPLFHRVE
jgi:hypothetical protein